MTLPRPPQRLLFIASIGNPKPYLNTRHSAGHILLDFITPVLPLRLGSTTPSSPYYTTFHSPSLMNISGPKLVKALQKWLSSRNNLPATLPATLVILHDELEAPLGKVRVKRGGPESASLRGHRGLISVFETMRGKGLFPARNGGKGTEGKEVSGGLDVLRVGVGIGRPAGREKDDVARYVLTEMEGREVDAVARAAESVVDVLEEEMCRVG